MYQQSLRVVYLYNPMIIKQKYLDVEIGNWDVK